MSSSVGLSTRIAVEAPQYSEASSVVARIEAQVGKIKDLFADVQALLNDIQALQAQAPDRNDPKYWTTDSDGVRVFDAKAFAKDLADFQAKLQNMNRRLEDVYRRLGQAQAIVQGMQSRDLPEAERRDAERIQKAAEAATKAMNDAISTLDEQRKTSENGGSDSQVEIRALEKKIEIKLDSDPAFKDVIRAFALMAQIVGDASDQARAARVVRMPAGLPGGGLPPVSTP